MPSRLRLSGNNLRYYIFLFNRIPYYNNLFLKQNIFYQLAIEISLQKWTRFKMITVWVMSFYIFFSSWKMMLHFNCLGEFFPACAGKYVSEAGACTKHCVIPDKSSINIIHKFKGPSSPQHSLLIFWPAPENCETVSLFPIFFHESVHWKTVGNYQIGRKYIYLE